MQYDVCTYTKVRLEFFSALLPFFDSVSSTTAKASFEVQIPLDAEKCIIKASFHFKKLFTTTIK